jgi:hypothetical protein
MDFGKVLQQVINQHKLRCDSMEGFMKTFGALIKRHETLMKGVQATLEASGFNNNLVVVCSHCGSETVLGMAECHVCGFKLFDVVTDEVVVSAPVVESQKAPPKETKTTEAALVEEPKRRGRPAKAKEDEVKTEPVKEKLQPMKAKEEVKPAPVKEEDELSFLDDDDFETVEPTKKEEKKEEIIEDVDDLLDDSALFGDDDFDDIELD